MLLLLEDNLFQQLLKDNFRILPIQFLLEHIILLYLLHERFTTEASYLTTWTLCSEPKLTNIRYVEVFVPQALQTRSRQQFVRDRLQIAEITRLPPRRRLEGCGSKVIMRLGANYANYALLAPCKTIKDFCYQIGS